MGSNNVVEDLFFVWISLRLDWITFAGMVESWNRVSADVLDSTGSSFFNCLAPALQLGQFAQDPEMVVRYSIDIKTDWLSTDSMAPKSDVSQELARASLMAISQSVPEENPTSHLLPVNPADVSIASAKETEETEKYRSELISIASIQSPYV
ncbi:Pyruvate kinase [Musa troglodytarum]|uniref:Pyruvate kinase n=1 Tax=Musa troglodytarum TaxID=320322 RepID=A0A9E7L4A0_9LILI|nr:Pyruvate kinase [Musa troglodytarum]